MSGIFTYEQFPFKSHPVLPCLDLFAVDGLYCAMSYCTGVFNRFLYFTITVWSYITWLLVYAVAWAYKKVLTKDLQVVYLQFVFPHIGQY